MQKHDTVKCYTEHNIKLISNDLSAIRVKKLSYKIRVLDIDHTYIDIIISM